MKFFPAFVFSSCTFFLCACSGDPAEEQKIRKDSAAVLRDSTAHLLLVPGPLQAVTVLRNECPVFEAQWLAGSDSGTAPMPDEYRKSLRLGVCLADMGYCVVYDQRQQTLLRLKQAQSLVKELELDAAINEKHIARFKANENRPDSLSKIILETYNKAHEFFTANRREAAGFFIVCGSYVESLHLLLNNTQLPRSRYYTALVGQQKIYLDNLVEILTRLEPDAATQDAYNTLHTLQLLFDEMKMEMKGEEVKAVFTAEQLAKLRAKTAQLRTEILL